MVTPDSALPTALAIAETRAWLEQAVIGLDLCPFAKAPHSAGRIRFICCDAEEPEALLEVLHAEMALLAAVNPSAVETTLIVHPRALLDFLDYNDFLDIADDALEALGLAGVLQIASFHHNYQFAGTDPDDIGNATNRSPYPTLQLLREASIERVIGGRRRAGAEGDSAGDNGDPDIDVDIADAIVQANIRTLEALGAAGWAAVRERCRRIAAAAVGAG